MKRISYTRRTVRIQPNGLSTIHYLVLSFLFSEIKNQFRDGSETETLEF